MTSITTSDFRARLLDDIEDRLTTNNYVFVSRYTPWANGTVVTPSDSPDDVRNAWDEMTYAKKVQPSDVAKMIARREWEANTVFQQYDDTESLGSDHVVTGDLRVYKCLDNNLGAVSTVEPTSTFATPFATADGYIWKYMFTIPSLSHTKFSTADRIPIVSNSTIEAAAIPGTIDRIDVLVSGNGWITHTGTISSAVNTSTFTISSTAETTNGYYDAHGFYVYSGPGSGFLSHVTNHFSNSTGNFVVTAAANSSVGTGSGYVLSPRVVLEGDGTGFRGVSVVDANTGGIVTRMDVIDYGQNYTWATAYLDAAEAQANATHSLRPVISPPNGHGANPEIELAADAECVSVTVANTDGIVKNAKFAVSGMLVDPLLANSTPATGSEYVMTHFANVTLNAGTGAPPNPYEEIVGQTSGSSATVVLANSTYVTYADVRGEFTVGETVRSSNTFSFFTVTAINSPQLLKYSGAVIQLSSFEPVTVSNVSTQVVKVVIEL
jgi:hypothetical protein